MDQISDFKCEYVPCVPLPGDSDFICGYCFVQARCDDYYSMFKDFTIKIDKTVYTIPPEAMAFQAD